MSLEFAEPGEYKSILVVEDDPIDRELMREMLRRAIPYDVRVVYSKSFRDVMENQSQRKYDMVFLDLNLPDNFGISTVKDLRRVFKDIPIIVITGIAAQLTIDECMNAGATKLVLKSKLNTKALTKLVDLYIK